MTAPRRQTTDEQPLIWLLALAVVLLGLAVIVRTIGHSQIARMRANADFVLIDNRTRSAVIVESRYVADNHPCTRKAAVVTAGNRARVKACEDWSQLVVRDPAGGAGRKTLNASHGSVYEVRRVNGELEVQLRDIQ